MRDPTGRARRGSGRLPRSPERRSIARNHGAALTRHPDTCRLVDQGPPIGKSAGPLRRIARHRATDPLEPAVTARPNLGPAFPRRVARAGRAMAGDRMPSARWPSRRAGQRRTSQRLRRRPDGFRTAVLAGPRSRPGPAGSGDASWAGHRLCDASRQSRRAGSRQIPTRSPPLTGRRHAAEPSRRAPRCVPMPIPAGPASARTGFCVWTTRFATVASVPLRRPSGGQTAGEPCHSAHQCAHDAWRDRTPMRRFEVGMLCRTSGLAGSHSEHSRNGNDRIPCKRR